MQKSVYIDNGCVTLDVFSDPKEGVPTIVHRTAFGEGLPVDLDKLIVMAEQGASVVEKHLADSTSPAV